MWRHMLMFLLVNTYGRSLGTPVNTQVWIPNLFNNLAKGCKNDFVSTQIGVKTKDCNVTTPPLHDLQFRCLVFYDASSVLCNIPSYPNIATDFTIKTSEKYNVSSFCGEAAHFNIPLTSNQKMMTKIFQDDVLCKNVCVDEDILTSDTNFVCKYYKWMLEVLQTVSTSSQGNATVADSAGKPSATELKEEEKKKGSEEKSNEVTTTNTNNTSNRVKEPEGDIKDEPVKEQNVQLNVNAVPGVDHSTEQLAGLNNQKNNQTKTLVESNNVEPKVNVIEEPEKHSSSDTGPENDIDHIAEKDPVEKDTVIENPQQGGVDDEENDDAGMDAVGDDNKEDNIDTEGDDSEDHIGDVDLKSNNEEKSSGKHIETQMTLNEGSQRDIFPNAMSDAFPEDDDHFFPFFLTVVIVVVVLYILYHNKNKVSKMFFGLIVEGRQPGRRRSSRGHAYRRLDTLEQAMSANTPAPPSKIIY